MALAITIHKGLEFGLINQIIGVIICIGLIAMVITGVYMWYKRKPEGSVGAPKAKSIFEYKGLLAVMIGFGIIFPLVGLSLIILFLTDRLIIRKNKTLRRWLNY